MIITLTTDFGSKDHYVGVIKGVILSVNPGVVITDITHEIPPHDIFKAAFTIRNTYTYFPQGTIHLAVVDPGVGGERRMIVIETDRYFFVGPDNGIFSFIYRESKSLKVFEISEAKYYLSGVSSTFHGRDIFAPVAAHLSLGLKIENFGRKIINPATLKIKEPVIRKNEIIGEVIYRDSFGNLITNIPNNILESVSLVKIADMELKGLSNTYSDVPSGEILALTGSSGFLEISVNRGNASKVIRKAHEKVYVKLD